MAKTWYLKLTPENVVEDCIEYEYDGYSPVTLDYLPPNILCGAYILTNGELIYHANLDLSKANKELEDQNKVLTEQVKALTEQNDFHESLIVELASIVYA